MTGRHRLAPRCCASAAPPASPATAPMPPAPVVDALIAAGGPAFLIFETLAERTLALAQLRAPQRSRRPATSRCSTRCCGRCWRAACAHGIRIVSNFGAANPRGAALRIARARRASSACARRASRSIAGDDLSGAAHRAAAAASSSAPRCDGAQRRQRQRLPRRRADRRGAATPAREIVVAGRVADPSLAVGPGAGALRLAPPTTGTGSAARRWPATCSNAARRSPAATSPTRASRTCPDLARVGFPIAEIDADGDCTIGKADGTGGLRRRAHGEGATALRGARPGGLPHARRRRRHRARRRSSEVGRRPRAPARRARPSRGPTRSRSTSCYERRLARRRRDLLRRRRAPRRARGWPPTCCASACARLGRCAST